jgi:hypothetical protein
MKVKDLIKELKNYPEDSEILFRYFLRFDHKGENYDTGYTSKCIINDYAFEKLLLEGNKYYDSQD